MTTNHIDTVRKHLLDQMQALRDAKDPKVMQAELERAKGLSELAQVACNTAKVEVDYLRATNQTSAPFMEAAVQVTSDSRTAGLPNGITSITTHKLKG